MPKLDGHRCPVNYSSSGNYCKPGKDAMPAMLKKGNCPVGWGSDGEYCVQSGRKEKPSSSSSSGSSSGSSGAAAQTLGAGTPQNDRWGVPVVASFAKKKLTDMCPSTFATHQEYCIATAGSVRFPLPAPAAVRFKEGAGCKAGETEEYGIYCVGPLAADWTYDRARGVFMRGYNDHYAVLARNDPQATKGMKPDEPASVLALKAAEDATKAATAPAVPPPDAAASTATATTAEAGATGNAAKSQKETAEAVGRVLGGVLNGLVKR